MYERSNLNIHSGSLIFFCHSTPLQFLIHVVLFHFLPQFNGDMPHSISSLSSMWICPIPSPPSVQCGYAQFNFHPVIFLEGNEWSLDLTLIFMQTQSSSSDRILSESENVTMSRLERCFRPNKQYKVHKNTDKCMILK